jgi:hypothetical protein
LLEDFASLSRRKPHGLACHHHQRNQMHQRGHPSAIMPATKIQHKCPLKNATLTPPPRQPQGDDRAVTDRDRFVGNI